MSQSSSHTLLWGALASLVTGMLIMSPSAAFLLYCLTAILALPAVLSAGRFVRLAALAMLATALLLAVDSYPKLKSDMQSYRSRATGNRSR